MIRRLMMVLAAFALMGAVACGGGEKKADETPTEQPESAPMAEEEAPAEEMDEAAADEGVDEAAPAEEGAEDASGAEEGGEAPAEESGE